MTEEDEEEHDNERNNDNENNEANGGDGGDAEAVVDQSVSQEGDDNDADVSNEGSANCCWRRRRRRRRRRRISKRIKVNPKSLFLLFL